MEQGRIRNRGQNRGQTVHATEGQEKTPATAATENPSISADWQGEAGWDNYCQDVLVGDTGLEPVTLRV